MYVNLFLLVLGGLMVGIAQVFNKRISSSNHDSKAYTVAVMLMGAIVSIPLLFVHFSLSTSLTTWMLILVSTIVYAFSTYFAFQAYKKIDVSLVAIIQRTSIVFIALIGIVVLKETYTFSAYLGLIFIFMAAVMVSHKKRHLVLNEGIVFALLMAITGAVASVLDKVILNDFSPYTYVFVNNLFVGLVFLFDLRRIDEAKKVVQKHFFPLLLSSLFSTGAFLLVLIVLQKTDVSRTMPMYKTLGLITPVALGILFLKERQMMWEKFLGILLGTLGIILLYWK